MVDSIFKFQGEDITFRNENGVVFVNATQMAKKFGKKPIGYLRLPSTIEFIKTCVQFLHTSEDELIITVMGSPSSGGGTWLHEDIALDFAQWLSPELRFWCNQKIKELLTFGSASINNSAEDMAKAKIAVTKFLIEELRPNEVSKNLILESLCAPFNIAVPEYVSSNGVVLSATELLKRNDINLSSKKFNLLLEECGYIEKKSRPSSSSKTGVKYFWSITEKGLTFGENLISKHNTRETQPMWYESKFTDLLSDLGLI